MDKPYCTVRGPPARRNFQDLVVWRKAHEVVLAVYHFTADFPRHETHNSIAEVFRRDKADKAQFMNVAEDKRVSCPVQKLTTADIHISALF